MSDKNFYLMKMVQFRFARTLTFQIPLLYFCLLKYATSKSFVENNGHEIETKEKAANKEPSYWFKT